jgi:hypothetical protein
VEDEQQRASFRRQLAIGAQHAERLLACATDSPPGTPPTQHHPARSPMVRAALSPPRVGGDPD